MFLVLDSSEVVDTVVTDARQVLVGIFLDQLSMVPFGAPEPEHTECGHDKQASAKDFIMLWVGLDSSIAIK